MRNPADARRLAVLGALLLAPLLCAGETPQRSSERELLITFLHINDVHGQIVPWVRDGRDSGGYARLATAVGKIRAAGEAKRCFLIHAGDEFSVKATLPQTPGTELTTRTKGEANIAVLNALRFDVWVPGNGEFYNGLQSIQARIREAQCCVLAANLTVKESGQPLAKTFVIEQAGPVKVAFFGLCWVRPETLTSVPLTLADAVETAKKLAPELRRQADVVVAVTHIGLGNDRKLAAAVDGLDLIVGAHSHDVLPKGELAPTPSGRKTLLCQAGECLQYLGRVDMRLALKDGKWQVAGTTAQLIRLEETVVPDDATAKLIESLKSGRAKAGAAATTPRLSPGGAPPVEQPAPAKTQVPAK